MIRSALAASVALFAAAVVVAAPASGVPTPPPPAATWSLGSPTTVSPTMAGGRWVFAAPTASAASLAVAPSTIEAYSYWADGVRLTGSGFAPGEPVTVTDTAPTGLRLTFETVPADATGRLDHVYTTEVNGAPVGQHQLRATGSRSGRSASALLTVVANANQTLRVAVTPAAISQDQFIRTPLTLTAYGLAPHERLYVNLAAPDGSGQQIGRDQALFADATGAFRYPLLGSTAAVPTGTWRLSVVAASGAYNFATYQVTPGPAPRRQGSVTFSPAELTDSELALNSLPWSARGLAAFQAYDLTLTSPLGVDQAIGTVRANGSGAFDDVLKPAGWPALGTYRLTATSRTSGNTATGTFIVTDARGAYPPNASITVSPRMLGASDASTAGRGFVVKLAHTPPGSGLTITVTAPDIHFPALRDGVTPQGTSSLFSSISADGTARVRVVFTRPQPAGTYRVDAYFANGHLSTTVVVTA